MYDAENYDLKTLENTDVDIKQFPIIDELSSSLNKLTLKMTENTILDDEDDYKLNSVESKELKTINRFIQSTLVKSKNNQLDMNKLFMFGETPSKLDKAVYLAIQGVDINSNIYPKLFRWYNYMKSKQSDMNSWRTPTKIITIQKNLP